MANIIEFPARHDAGSPDLRGTVLAHVLHHGAMVPGPVTVFNSTLEAMGRHEEECSLEIMAAAHILVGSELLVSNTFAEDGLSITADTTLTAAPWITG